MTPDANITIERLTDAYPDAAALAQVVDLHQQTFPQGVLSILGREFVSRYYLAITSTPTTFLWVARSGQRVVGYLACTMDRHAFEQIHRLGAARNSLLWRIATFRISPWAVLRAFRKRKLTRNCTDPAELISIAVAEEYRRCGLGARFLAMWAETLRQYGMRSYLVFTDNHEGYRFYTKQGGEQLFAFTLGGETSAAFRIHLKPQPNVVS